MKNDNLIIETESQINNSETVGDVHVKDPRIIVKNVNVHYGEKQAINNVSIDIGKNEVLAMIGPSGCGKSTFLRCLNRMNDTIESCVVKGEIYLDNENILDKKTDVVPLRAKVGMVFQKPNPFPKSIYENVAYGPKIHGLAKNKIETIKEFREDGFYATSVHINNNIYSVFKNKVELKGVNEFINHFVAIPCGWWLNKI